MKSAALPLPAAIVPGAAADGGWRLTRVLSYGHRAAERAGPGAAAAD